MGTTRLLVVALLGFDAVGVDERQGHNPAARRSAVPFAAMPLARSSGVTSDVAVGACLLLHAEAPAPWEAPGWEDLPSLHVDATAERVTVARPGVPEVTVSFAGLDGRVAS